MENAQIPTDVPQQMQSGSDGDDRGKRAKASFAESSR